MNITASALLLFLWTRHYMSLPAPRVLLLAIFFGCAALLITAIFIEPFKSMDPCPMCMMQRVCFFGLGLFALIATLHNAGRIGQKIYGVILSAFSITGASIAIRQLWLQSLPEEQVPACGPGLEYMLDVFPLLEVIEMAIRGTGDCAKVQWTYLGVSIPGWSIFAFAAFTIIALIILFKKQAK